LWVAVGDVMSEGDECFGDLLARGGIGDRPAGADVVLGQGYLVLRYRNQDGMNADGLTGEEGTFVICSFWLVSALAKAGELDRAERLFDKLVFYANDLGLLAEEIDTATGELLGNFPQAFSHIGLITAAWEIDQARGRVS